MATSLLHTVTEENFPSSWRLVCYCHYVYVTLLPSRAITWRFHTCYQLSLIRAMAYVVVNGTLAAHLRTVPYACHATSLLHYVGNTSARTLRHYHAYYCYRFSLFVSYIYHWSPRRRRLCYFLCYYYSHDVIIGCRH